MRYSKGRDHLEGLGIYEMKGFIRLRIGTIDGLY
jgi:hypothetical protein